MRGSEEGRERSREAVKVFFLLPPSQSALDVKQELAIRVFCCLKVSFMFYNLLFSAYY